MTPAVSSWWSELAGQWRGNPRLRIGAWLVLAILWLYGLLAAADEIERLQAQVRQGAAALARDRSIAAQTGWPERADQARKQLDTARTLLWSEPERGLAEAALQDSVNTLASKVGANVRERTLLRGDSTDARSVQIPDPAASAATVLPPGHAVVRMRVVFDFTPVVLSSFLAELSPAPRLVKVDRLRVFNASKPASVELEVSALVRIAPKGKS